MMNGLQTLPQWRAYFGQPTAPILGTMNAIYPLGKFIRVFISAFIWDRFGRKIPMYLGLTLLILGAGLQGGSRNIPMFVIARLTLGFACSFVSQNAPILITELAYPTHRGR
jgi:MFS family permease